MVSPAVDRPAIRALFLVDVGPIPARVVWAWREGGHEVAEIWTGGGDRRSAWKRDRRLRWVAPRWSLSAAMRRWRLSHKVVEDLSHTSDISAGIKKLNVDVIISVHFMRILPRNLLEQLRMPVLNLHPSLLPKYRGPASLLGMLLDEMQDDSGGVTLHGIVPAIDAGPIFAALPVTFPTNRKFRVWELDLARTAATLAVENVPRVLDGSLRGVEQAVGSGNYRRIDPRELVLTTALTSERVRWLCDTIGRFSDLRFHFCGRACPITGISKHLGPPTNQKPLVNWFTIETDLADARVRLRRKPVWEGRRRRLEAWLIRASASP